MKVGIFKLIKDFFTVSTKIEFLFCEIRELREDIRELRNEINHINERVDYIYKIMLNNYKK